MQNKMDRLFIATEKADFNKSINQNILSGLSKKYCEDH